MGRLQTLQAQEKQENVPRVPPGRHPRLAQTNLETVIATTTL